ncbi:hypothetical protein [Saccharibacillus sp. JS10]|uniref:hypothetical protein n=1 Tax=Saccharibacillus sp. JS10 TaxID=2950552 RepID=UPI00210B6603|nr:hypothetical protein [Saccharibacillus sp. JS10]MCQ4085934.1 hypothetical protein [Saccharibacillus sp. JS10]
MYGHTFAQALNKLEGDELRLMYVLCCDTAVQELLVSKIRDWIKREPERFAKKLEEKVVFYRQSNDDDLRLGILLELSKRAKLVGMPLSTASELEQFAGGIVEQIEIGVSEEDRSYLAYREEHPDVSELEALIDYQIVQWMQSLGRLLDTASQEDWERYMQRISSILPDRSEVWQMQEATQSERSEPMDSVFEEVSQQAIAESPEAAFREQELGEITPEPMTSNDPESEPESNAEEPTIPTRPSGAKILLQVLEQQQGFAYYEAAMTLLAAAEGLMGIGQVSQLNGSRIAFLHVSASPAFLQVLPNGGKNATLSMYRNLNPQRRRLPILLTQLFLPELVSEDAQEADVEPLLALWRSHAAEHARFQAEIAEEQTQIDYYTREAASCAEQLEAAKNDRASSKQRIAEIRSSLVDKLRVSSMQLPHISAFFDQLLHEYADNHRRMGDAEASRQERTQGFAGLVKYTLNYAASSVTLIDLRRKQDRLLEKMAEEALRSDGEWGQGERYVVAAEQERINALDVEISRLDKLQAEYREKLRTSEQQSKWLEQDQKKLEKQVYGLADLEHE